MAFSLYEVDDYQDVAKPSNLMQEDNYLNDVFFQTRPELMEYDDKGTENKDDKRNPFYKERDRDRKEDKGDHGKSDTYHDWNTNNWQNQDSYFVKGSSSQSVKNVIAAYKLENETANKKGKVRTAATMADLMRYTSRFSRKKAPRTNVKLVKADLPNMKWTYRVHGYEKYSNSKGHQVIINLVKDPDIKDLRGMTVQVSCSCPFWKYYGPDYNANRGDYLEGRPYSNGSFPEQRDPRLRNIICKHVYAVGLVFQRFAAKNNLDTFKDVDKVLDVLKDEKDAFLPEVTVTGLKDISRRLKPSERRKIDPIIKKYENEKNDKRKDKLMGEVMTELKDALDVKDKNFLVRVFNDVKNFFTKKKREKRFDKNKKSSLINVLGMYREETGETNGNL